MDVLHALLWRLFPKAMYRREEQMDHDYRVAARRSARLLSRPPSPMENG